MISIRNASVTVVGGLVFALGLMGCVNEGRAQPQVPETTSATASYDPSSMYQPSPNSRALAVQPPPTVTGHTGASTTACSDSPGAAITSPNLRACP